MNFEFSHLLLRIRSVSPRRFCHTAFCVFLSTRWLTTNLCTIRWRTIVQVSLGGVRAFSDGPFCNISLTSWYIRCRSEGPCLAPRLLFFIITCPGIEVTWLFCSNSVGLCDDFIFLPQLQQIFRFPNRHCSQDIVVWKSFRKSSKISVLFLSAINSCDSWLNLWIFCVWLKS